MIYCGTDIIEIDRIKKSIEDMGDRFLNKIFTNKEREYCESKNQMKFQHYAARFAAKEAVFKAVSNALENKYELGWQNVEIENNQDGRPDVKFVNYDIKDLIQIDLSISHCESFAVAMCVVNIK